MADPRSELIRIDQKGVAHPIGVVASQRMRPHQGAYRLLPSPDHVVLMRYTGEDGVVDADDGAIVRLAGEIVAAGTICDIFALLAQTGWRGVLSVHQDSTTRSIYLDKGSVVGVKTNAAEERLGRVLYHYGKRSKEQLASVEYELKHGQRFGETAINLGYLSQEDIYKGFAKQITEVVVGAMHVSDGTYFFLDGFQDGETVSQHAVSINALLMDGVTRMDEMRYFEEKIPSSDHVPKPLSDRSPPPDNLVSLFAMVDGQKNVKVLGRLSGLGEFETTKRLYGLLQSKHISIKPPLYSEGPAAIVLAANEVLFAIFEHAQKTAIVAEIRQSLDGFKVGAGVFYDMLFQGAGPDHQGRLDVARVIGNAPMVAQGEDIKTSLRKLLFDYVSFALYSLGSLASGKPDIKLTPAVEAALSVLRPSS